MTDNAEKTKPELWEKIKAKVQKESKGGKPGQWSARKAQLAVHDYKDAGGSYKGPKSADNHLAQWTREDWDTKSGKPSGKTGERYLPKVAREALSDADYKHTSAKKRSDSRRGKQYSRQPEAIAHEVSNARLQTLTVVELRKRAATANVAGRSRMTKDQLVAALSMPTSSE